MGLAVGTPTGSPLFGFFMGGLCGWLGSMAGSAVFSEAAKMFCYYAGCELVEPVWTLPWYFNDVAYCSFDGSAGTAHNVILYELENNGKNYIDANGNLLVAEMFLDALHYEEDLHIEGSIKDANYIDNVKNICEKFYTVIKTNLKPNASGEQIRDQIYGFLRENGLSEEDVEMLEKLDEALLPSINIYI